MRANTQTEIISGVVFGNDQILCGSSYARVGDYDHAI
jgi:hypothetical protein